MCGKTESRQEQVNEVFDIEGKSVWVEQIPATVCLHCGEPVFSREAAERVRRMAHGSWGSQTDQIDSDGRVRLPVILPVSGIPSLASGPW
jgi:HTH-type transcriptional regulator / antitoxin MqsA